MTFTVNWAQRNFPIWEKILKGFSGRVLEIGTYEGMSAKWFKEHGFEVWVVDLFEEIKDDKGYKGIDTKDLYKRFKENVKGVNIIKGNSHKVIWLNFEPSPTFDVVYIDGDHTARGTLEDICDTFRLLKIGGIMIIDDYNWVCYDEITGNPKQAIDSFLACFAKDIKILHKGEQVIVQKVSDYKRL